MADQSWKTSLSLGPYKTSFPSTVIYSILSKATCKLGLPILITRYGSRWLLNFCYLAWHLYAKMRKCIYFQVSREVYTVAWPSGLRRWFKAPVSSEVWVLTPPLPSVSFSRKWTIRQYFLHKNWVLFFFLFLHSCFNYLWYFIKKEDL